MRGSPFLLLAIVTAASVPAFASGDLIVATNANRVYSYTPGSGQLLGGERLTGSLVGLEFFHGKLYQLNSLVGPNANALLEIDPITGNPVRVLDTGLRIIEGDLAYDPRSGRLLGSAEQAASGVAARLFEIDLATGQATPLSTGGAGGLSGSYDGLSFDARGNLYAINADNPAGGNPLTFARLDPSTGAVIEDLSFVFDGIDINTGVNGLDFDPFRRVLYAGGPAGAVPTNELMFEIALDTWEVREIDRLSLPTGNGFAGIAFIPSPGSAVALAATPWFIRRRR